MSHSVNRHLGVKATEYDEAIRRFIPGYDAMLDKAVLEVAKIRPGRVLDLGAGTGALAERFLARPGQGVVELWDIDVDMLDIARARLTDYEERTLFVERSYDAPFPPCDAIMASLSLHHIADLDDKAELFTRAFEALRPGGVFVSADVTMPDEGPELERRYQGWAEHLMSHGISEAQAWKHFADWAEEDTYFPLEDELEVIEEAGFTARCAWRQGPSTVLVGEKV